MPKDDSKPKVKLLRDVAGEEHYVQVPIETHLKHLRQRKKHLLDRDEYLADMITGLESLGRLADNILSQKRKPTRRYPPAFAPFMDLLLLSTMAEGFKDVYNQLRFENVLSYQLIDDAESIREIIPNLATEDAIKKYRRRVSKNEPFIKSLRKNFEKQATEQAKKIRKRKALLKRLETTARRLYS